MRRAAVVDASAFVNLLVDPGWGGGTDAVLGAGRHFVPGHFDVEVSSALNGLVRGGSIAADAVPDLIETTLSFPAVRVLPAALARQAWPLRGNLSLYDAFYLALARELQGDLITADRSLARVQDPGVPIRLVQ